MKIRRFLSVFLACLMIGTACMSAPVYAASVDAAKKPAEDTTDDAAAAPEDTVEMRLASAGAPALTIKAKAALLVDETCGLTLYEQNSHEKMYPASITKVMTALLTLEAVSKGQLAMDQKITVSPTAMTGLDEDGSTAGIVAGEQISVQDLLYCLMVVSANEAANILAETVAGSIDAFVELMNAKAQELGCKDTRFANPSGLHDPNHYTTAWDIYLFTRAAMKYDAFMTICNTKAYDVPATNKSEARELHSTNFLISTWLNTGYFYDREDINAYAEGIKTGTTDQAGHCLVSSAVCGDRRVISVVLGAGTEEKNGETRVLSFDETVRLFNWGFDNFSMQTVLTEDEVIQEVPVALSKETNCVLVHPAENTQALLPNGVDPEKLTRTVTLTNEIADAPIKAGDVMGEVTVSYNGVDYVTVPLLALSDVTANRFLVVKDAIYDFFRLTVVKILLAVLVVAAVAIAVWWRMKGRDRRYGKSNKRYRHRSYRGRR